MFEAKGIHKSFGKTQVLKGVDISVNQGDVVTIIGPSGSGKTTLLRCLDFLETADGGELDFNELHVNINRPHKSEILSIRRKTAFVFQNYNLFNNKTALENVMEGLITARKIPFDEAKKRAESALDKVGLSKRYEYYPHQLSGGQQQRVGIARAIAVNPELIFFDEPTSALDPELVEEVLAVIRKLTKEGMTMIIVTHELSFAEDVSSNIIFMSGGLVVEQGKPSEIFSNPKDERTRKFLKRFLQTDNYVI